LINPPAVDVVPPDSGYDTLLYQVLQSCEGVGMALPFKAVEHHVDVAMAAHHHTKSLDEALQAVWVGLGSTMDKGEAACDNLTIGYCAHNECCSVRRGLAYNHDEGVRVTVWVTQADKSVPLLQQGPRVHHCCAGCDTAVHK
jgi:hypothetical protein